ncbi:MAG TPA: ATP-binding protein, partial [Acidimicrobiales bacterium]|nr:ATP-binding protein [Acidimicrobiales bacterium]
MIRALAQQQGAAILGREQELTALREFLEAGSARAFVVSGPPGIGKTTLWRAALELATSTGLRVLSARAAEAESQLSFAGLSDLLESVDSELGALPAPQRRALEAAVLRAEPDAQPQSHLALGTGLLGVLRALARPTGLLLALDDAQWLDEASCAAIGFAARRLSGEPVKFLLTRRAEATSRLEQVFPTLEVASAKLAGLSFGAIRAVLSQGENAPLPRRVLRQVYETSGGNCLFALEIARLLARRGPSEVGEDLPVPELVEEAVAARVASLPAPAADALLVAALSPGVPRPQLVALVGAIALDQVRDAAVVTIERDRVRAAHPLLAAAVLAQSTPEARRSMHRALGAVVTEDELRWRHLALGADGPDAALATQLTR